MDTDTTPQTPPDDASGDAPGPEEIAISNRWARRRLDLYAVVERTVREGISGALQTAAEIRTEVEQDAETYLQRLADERERLNGELAGLESRRQTTEAALEERRRELEADLETRRREGEAEIARRRQETEEELARLRREAEEEVARLRSTTREEIDTLVQEAETRRARVAAEVRALEEQVVQIQGVIDSFLDSQLQTLRGSLGGARPGGAPRGAPGAAAGGAPAGWPPPGGADATGEGDAAGEASEAGAAGGTGDGAGMPAGVDLAGAGASRPAPEGTERTAVVITGVPHFSRARALWQAIQEVPGVAEAKATTYQGGVLNLDVQHDPALDLPAAVAALPGLRLRVDDAAPGEVRLSVEP
jgi:hypothetical protein